MKRLQSLALLLLLSGQARAQGFMFGSDLSYANQMEDCGAVFREDGAPKDVYRIFADHGTNLVRARLWVDPVWQNGLAQPAGVKAQYSDLDDVTETFRRARAAGMQLMLGLHYSDFWADPGTQIIPARWSGVADDLDALKDSVYAYTYDVLTRLDAAGLMPDIVKVGNEANGGLLRHRTLTSGFDASGSVDDSWTRQAELYNAAIRAVRDAGAASPVSPLIALHMAGLGALQWWYENITAHGVTDFDIMGFSYYYAWHGSSIEGLGDAIRGLRDRFPQYEAMVVETGYAWTNQNVDGLGNIITETDPAYDPRSQVRQREYLADYSREVMRAGGSGVVFWEPAWVSTDCRTPWGQGSSQEHVAFFGLNDYNFLQAGAGTWPRAEYYADLEAVKVSFVVDMAGQSIAQGVFIDGSMADSRVRLDPLGNGRFATFFYLPVGSDVSFRFLNGDDAAAAEEVPDACGTAGMRTLTVPDGASEFEIAWGQCGAGTSGPMDVSFVVDMAGQDISRGVYITGHVTDWQIIRMIQATENLFVHHTQLDDGATGAYYHLTTSTWDSYLSYRESVPSACATWYGSDRGYSVSEGSTVFAVRWSTCTPVAWPTAVESERARDEFFLSAPFPNPTTGSVAFSFSVPQSSRVRAELHDMLGRRVVVLMDVWASPGTAFSPTYSLGDLAPGVYRLILRSGQRVRSRPLIVAR